MYDVIAQLPVWTGTDCAVYILCRHVKFNVLMVIPSFRAPIYLITVCVCVRVSFSSIAVQRCVNALHNWITHCRSDDVIKMCAFRWFSESFVHGHGGYAPCIQRVLFTCCCCCCCCKTMPGSTSFTLHCTAIKWNTKRKPNYRYYYAHLIF